MRVLLDENLPVDLAKELHGHEVQTVRSMGWSGVKNGELLKMATDRFEAFITMDSNLAFQQPIERQAFGVIVLSARSNRLEHLAALVPEILDALNAVEPGQIRRVVREGD